jgi:hypothetical protein
MPATLDKLDEGARSLVVDALIAQATRTTSGWKPTRQAQRIVEKARSFTEAARHIGDADPDECTR